MAHELTRSHNTVFAISSGRLIRPMGSCEVTCARPSGVPPVKATHHRCIDVPWADGIDANVLRHVVERRGAREPNHAMLRRRVSRVALDADMRLQLCAAAFS